MEDLIIEKEYIDNNNNYEKLEKDNNINNKTDDVEASMLYYGVNVLAKSNDIDLNMLKLIVGMKNQAVKKTREHFAIMQQTPNLYDYINAMQTVVEDHNRIVSIIENQIEVTSPYLDTEELIKAEENSARAFYASSRARNDLGSDFTSQEFLARSKEILGEISELPIENIGGKKLSSLLENFEKKSI